MKQPSAESTIDRSSFDRFYRAAHGDVARAVILAVGRHELGLDATNEAFTRAWERWDDVAGYANPNGWVYRVAINWARSRLRRSWRDQHQMLDVGYEDAVPEPELLAAVQALPFRYRTVVVARFFFDWSIEATAQAMDLPTGTVKTRQHRALARLRKNLGERHED